VDQPTFDASINVVGLANLLEGAGEGCQTVHLRAAAAWCRRSGIITPETAGGESLRVSKLSGEYHSERLAPAVSRAWRCAANVWSPTGPKSKPSRAIFAPRLPRSGSDVFGDGKQTRDYVP
jgi:nucleoside-diphosphate-sugar epimerase